MLFSLFIMDYENEEKVEICGNMISIETITLDISRKNLNRLPPNIKKLTKLKVLYCHYNNLTNIDELFSISGLRFINCSNNKITNINYLPYGLQEIYFSNNLITSLDNLPYNIKNFDNLPPQLVNRLYLI